MMAGSFAHAREASRRCTHLRILLASVGGLFLLASCVLPAQAQTSWVGGTDDWFTSGNWDNGVPIASQAANVSNGGTAQIGAAATFSSLSISGTSKVELQSGGSFAGDSGSITLLGSGTLRFAASLSVSNAINYSSTTGATLLAATGATVTLTGGQGFGTLGGRTTIGSVSDAGKIVFSPSGSSASTDQIITVAGGTVQAGSLSGALAIGAGGLAIASGATVDVNDYSISGNGERLVLSGSGSLKLGSSAATVVELRNGTSFSGAISGSGGVTIVAGSGTATLTGNNTYSGGTTITSGTLQIGTGGALGNIPGDVTNNGTLAIYLAGGAAGQIYSGSISGTGALNLLGSTTFVVTGNSTYSGGTTITAGATLYLGNFGTSGSIVGDVVNQGAIVFERTDDVTFAGAISGAGELTKFGTNTLTLTGASSYSGNTFLEGGTLVISAANNIGASSNLLNFFDDSTVRFNAGMTLSGGGGIVAGKTATFDTNGNTVTLSGQITAAGGIKKVGTGTLILTAGNFYSGGTTISAGVVFVSANNNLGDSSGGVTLNGGALQFGASFNLSSSRAISLGVSGGTIDTNGFNTNIQQAIGGTGGLTKAGTGTLTLQGANSYGGGTTISGGTLQIGNGGATGAISGNVADNGTLVFDRSNTYSFAGVISGTGAVQQIGAGTTILTGTNTYSGGTTITAGVLQIGDGVTSGAIAGNVTDNTTLAYDPSSNVVYSGVISGSGALSVLGTGTLALTGANTYSGGTTITGGSLDIGNGGTSGSVSGNITDNGLLTFHRSDSVVYAGNISGTGQVHQDGSGTLTLSGINTYSGATTVSAGILKAGAGNVFSANSAYAVAGGAVLALNSFDNTIGSLTGAGSVTLGSGTLLTGGDNSSTVFSGAISGSGQIIKIGSGVLRLTGANSYSGYTSVNAGVLVIGDGATNGSVAGNIADNAILIFDRSNSVSFANNIIGSGQVYKQGAGTLTLSGMNSYTGATFVAFGTLRAGATNTFSPNSDMYVLSGTTLDLNNFSQSTGALSGTGTVTLGSATLTATSVNTSTFAGVISGSGGYVKAGTGNTLFTGANTYTGGTTVNGGALVIGGGGTSGSIVGNIANNALLLFNRSDTATFSGNISGTGQVYQEGNGILQLAGSNGYSGATFIAAGTLRGFGANTLSPNSDMYVLSGTTLDLDGFGETIGSLSGTGSVTLGSATLMTNGDNANTAFSGVISGTGGLVKSGSGTLILSNDNTYSGTTAVGAGILQLGNGGTAGSVAGNISVASGAKLVFDRSDSVTYSGVISGAGSVTQSGGTLILSGTSTYQGGTTIASGALVIGTAGSIVGNIFDNALLLFAHAGNFAFAGNISGTGQVYLAGGSETLTLTGTNTYSNATFVTGGTLKAGAANTFSPNSDLYILCSYCSTLDLNNFNQTTGALGGDGTVLLGSATLTATSINTSTFQGVMSGTGAFIKGGTGNTLFSGNNTYTGGTTITGGGALVLGAGGTTGSIVGNVAITDANSLLLFNRSDDVIFSGNISGIGQVYQAGSGVLMLAGSNSYSGATFVTAGTLRGLGTNTLSPNSSIYVLGTTLDLDNFNQTAGTVSGNGNVTLGSARLTLASNSNAAFSGVISGTGGVTKLGSGTFYVSGNNSYSGGTTLSAGTVQVANGGKLGTGTVTLSGGALLLSNGVTIANAMSIATSSFINVNTGDSATISGQLSGSAPFEKDGGGTLVLTNTNNASTYSGNISYHGTLTCGNGSCGSGTLTFLGTVLAIRDGFTVSNGLVLADSGDVDVASGVASITGDIGEVNGTWGLSKLGAGQLNLTGNGSYGGPTVVQQGTLVLSGTIKGMAIVNAGATLALSANVEGGVTVAAGGRLAPVDAGSAPAVLSTTSLNDQGGTYVVRFGSGPAGYVNDKIVVAGPVSLDRGVVDARPIAAASGYTFNQRYSIITSSQPVTGTFSNPASFVANAYDPALLQRLRYDLGGVVLEVRHLLDFTQMGGAITANQIAVAKALNNSEPAADDAWANVVNTLAQMTPAARQNTFDRLSGASMLSSLEGSVDSLVAFDDLVQAHMLGFVPGARGQEQLAFASPAAGPRGWSTAFHDGQPTAGFAAQNGYLTSANQSVAGVDVGVDRHLSLGFAFSSNQPLGSGGGLWGRAGGTATSYSAYARYQLSDAILALTASAIDAGRNEGRNAAMGDVAATRSGHLRQQAQDIGLSLSDPSLFRDLNLTPVITIRYLNFGQNASDEASAVDGIGLNVASRQSAFTTASLGLDWRTQFENGDLILAPEFATYIQFADGDLVPKASATLTGAPQGTGTFVIQGDGLSPVSETFIAGLAVGAFDNRLSFAVRTTTHLSANAIQSSAQLHLDWQW